MPPPLLNRFVGGYAGSAPTAGSLEARHRVRAKPSALQALSLVSRSFYTESGNASIQLILPVRAVIDLSIRKDSRFHVRSGRFYKWPVTGLPEKRLPSGNPTSGSWLSVVGSASFWPKAGAAKTGPRTAPATRHDTKAGAIRRPNKFIQSSATLRLFWGRAVQKPETRHRQAPNFGISQGHLIPPDGRGTRWSPVIGASSSGCRAIGSEGRDPAPTAG
jgi:hypothetical protein